MFVKQLLFNSRFHSYFGSLLLRGPGLKRGEAHATGQCITKSSLAHLVRILVDLVRCNLNLAHWERTTLEKDQAAIGGLQIQYAMKGPQKLPWHFQQTEAVYILRAIPALPGRKILHFHPNTAKHGNATAPTHPPTSHTHTGQLPGPLWYS